MILDHIENAALYREIPGIGEALEYLAGLAPGAGPAGPVRLPGGEVVINPARFTTRPWAECRYEGHRRCADIHYILEGVEGIAVQQVAKLRQVRPYSPEKDIAFYEGDAQVQCWLHPGEFLITFPDDAHRVAMAPEGRPAPVRKLVAKVKLGED